MPGAAHSRSGYFPHINWLRAFAALSVLVYHVIELGKWESFTNELPFKWFRIGWMSVDLFFVISGFVIAWGLLQMQAKGISGATLWRSFMRRRFARVAPLFYLTCLAYVFAIEPNLLHWSEWKHWLTHALFIHSWDKDTFGSMNGINWSIAIEMQFYVLMVATLYWWSRWHPLKIIAVGCAVAFTCRAAIVAYAEHRGWEGPWPLFPYSVQMPMMLDEFACGIALAVLIWRYPPSQWPGKCWVQGLGLLVALGVMGTIAFEIYFAYYTYWGYPAMVIFWRSLIALFFALVIAVAVWLPAPQKPGLIYRTGYYLGEISYGIYLWHLIMSELLKPHFIGNAPGLLLAVLPLTLAMASFSWHWVEKPFIAWAKQSRDTAHPAAAAA